MKAKGEVMVQALIPRDEGRWLDGYPSLVFSLRCSDGWNVKLGPHAHTL